MPGISLFNAEICRPHSERGIFHDICIHHGYYEDLINAAFALKYYETSPVIEIKTASDDGYFILFRTRKSDAHFEECYDDIATVYVENAIGKMIVDRTAALLSTLVKTENYNKIEHSKISMN